MLTPDDIRKAALSMPQVYEEPHFEMASFRVNRKIFCTIHVKAPRIMLRLDTADQHNLSDGVSIEPVPGTWGRNGSTFVWSEKLDPERLPALMHMAWAQVAPKRLLRL